MSNGEKQLVELLDGCQAVTSELLTVVDNIGCKPILTTRVAAICGQRSFPVLEESGIYKKQDGSGAVRDMARFIASACATCPNNPQNT